MGNSNLLALHDDNNSEDANTRRHDCVMAETYNHSASCDAAGQGRIQMGTDFEAEKVAFSESMELVEQNLNTSISLRQWLSNPCRVIDKVQSLHIFRQIVEFVELAHSQGVVLRNVRPSSFLLSSMSRISIIDSASSPSSTSSSDDLTGRETVAFPGNEPQPIGHTSEGVELGSAQWQCAATNEQVEPENREDPLNVVACRNGPVEEGGSEQRNIVIGQMANSSSWSSTTGMQDMLTCSAENYGLKSQGSKSSDSWSDDEGIQPIEQKFPLKHLLSMEELWYKSPEELAGGTPDFCSDVYSLGVLLLELFYCAGSDAERSRAMSDIRHRMLPPRLLLQHPKEAAFCLLLLHPDPSFRPKAREILHAHFFGDVADKLAEKEAFMNLEEKLSEAEVTLGFLLQMQQEKHIITRKLSTELNLIKADIEEVKRWQIFLGKSEPWDKKPADSSTLDITTQNDSVKSHLKAVHRFYGLWNSQQGKHERLMAKASQLKHNFYNLKKVYFSMMHIANPQVVDTNGDMSHLSRKTGKQELVTAKDNPRVRKPRDHFSGFFDSLCNFIRYTHFDVKAALNYGDLLNTGNMVCSLDFDCNGEFFASAGVSKKIKVFDFKGLLEESHDMHYPVVEMVGRRKLSCVSWNVFHKNQLASSDLEGGIQLWDVVTGKGILEYREHDKCVWSVDFSHTYPVRLVSGSDDCCVKIWSTNQGKSIGTIRTKANVCCVRASLISSHLLGFGSADSNVYCYDLRYVKVPVCTLTGHQKAVSFIRFIDSVNIVSASTDNTLKLWDLTMARADMKAEGSKLRAGNACLTTFKGHSNEKNFVGLSVGEGGYIACGSETNEVFVYHKSLPMALLAHKFGATDPASGQEVEDSGGQFVSSVCWRERSQTLVAANSVGNIKILEMV